MQSEFQFIEKIRRRARGSGAVIGIGDDCAVLPKDSKTDTVITTDLLVEDIDFRRSWTTPELLGHKALAVSLSDIAAMGAKPVWALVSIGVPEVVWKTDFVEKFYDGWFQLAEKHSVQLVGGDLSRTPDKIVIDSICAGEVRKNKAVRRSTAKPGDQIFVTGWLGAAAAGLKLLESGANRKNSNHKKLQRRQLAPEPQTIIGMILGAHDLATAMIDLSDGFSADLAHLARASGVGAQIFADQIPVDPALPKSFGDLSEILRGGEDFELLFTVNPKKISRLENLLKNHQISRVGIITETAEKIELITKERIEILAPAGFRHF